MSFDQDPNEQANISGADLAIMCTEMAQLRAELAEIRAQEPVAIRYETAKGVYRYRSFVESFAREYAILKPINLYARPTPAAQAVPMGYALAPIEPTPEMLEAAHLADQEYTLRNFGDIMTVQQGPYDHWCAMIAAAPPDRRRQMDSIFTIMRNDGTAIEIFPDGRVTGIDGEFAIVNGIASALHFLLAHIPSDKRREAADGLISMYGNIGVTPNV